MSEHRKSIEDWIILLPQSEGKKRVKIELFRAGLFRDSWSPYESNHWFPKPPMQTAARARFWDQRFRVRIDGRWWGSKAKYQTLTMDDVYQKIVKKIAR